MSRKYIVTATAALLCAAGVVLVAGRKHTSADESSDGARSAPRVAVAVARRTKLANTLSIAGEFLPYQEVELHAKVAGYIRKINVDIGDRVRDGQVLAVLEIPELTAQVQEADANVRHSQEEITRAQQEVRRAEADYAAVHAAYQRLQQAAEARPGLIAQQELDDAAAKDGSSDAQVQASKSALSAAQQQLEVDKAERSHYAALSDYSRITAPFDGVVTWRFADTGALIQAGTSNETSLPVVKLAQVNILRLRIPVPESLAANIHDGESADIHVQATGEHFTGKVSRFTDALDRSTRTMQVEVDVPNPGYKLEPGMYADVALDVQDQPDALTIPVQALILSGDKTSVLMVDQDNRVEVREIRVGMQEPDRVEVVSGLKAGDQVIVGNLSAYQPGELVSPAPSAMAESGFDSKE